MIMQKSIYKCNVCGREELFRFNTHHLNNCNGKITKQVWASKDEKWKPYCFGEYQGVGDDSCFECPYQKECYPITLCTQRVRKVKI